MGSINNLPNEILERFFSFLSPYEDLNNCRLVCQRWNNLLKNAVKRRNVIFVKALLKGNLRWKNWNPARNWEARGQRAHAVTRYKDKMFIMEGFGSLFSAGGYTLYGLDNDLWVFDLSKKTWTKCHSRGSRPPMTRQSTIVAHEDRLIVFAGEQKYEQPYYKIYVYNMLDNYWTCPAFSFPWPEDVYGHSATIHGRKMVVFGGMQINSVTHRYEIKGHVWTFDLDNFKWTWQMPLGIEPDLWRMNHFQVRLDDENLLIAGGFLPDKFDKESCKHFTSMWILSMGPAKWEWHQIPVKKKDYGPTDFTNITNAACVFEDKLFVLPYEEDDDRIVLPEIPGASKNVKTMYICDLSHVLDPEDPHAEWMEPRKIKLDPGVKLNVTRFSSLVAGNGELLFVRAFEYCQGGNRKIPIHSISLNV